MCSITQPARSAILGVTPKSTPAHTLELSASQPICSQPRFHVIPALKGIKRERGGSRQWEVFRFWSWSWSDVVALRFFVLRRPVTTVAPKKGSKFNICVPCKTCCPRQCLMCLFLVTASEPLNLWRMCSSAFIWCSTK